MGGEVEERRDGKGGGKKGWEIWRGGEQTVESKLEEGGWQSMKYVRGGLVARSEEIEL